MADIRNTNTYTVILIHIFVCVCVCVSLKINVSGGFLQPLTVTCTRVKVSDPSDIFVLELQS